MTRPPLSTEDVHFRDSEGKMVVRAVEITHWLPMKSHTVAGGQVVTQPQRPDWRQVLPDYEVREVVGQVVATPRELLR